MKNENYSSNYSRRQFIKLLGLAGIGINFLSLQSCFDNNKQIRFYGTGTLDIGNKWKKLESDLGVKLLFEDNGNDTGPIIANIIQGNAGIDFQVAGIQGGVEKELFLANKILPWDLNKVPNWNSMWSWVKDIPYCKIDGKQYGLPIVVNADSIIYLPDKIGGIVDSYEVIFDPKFKGRTSMEDAWINSVIFTAIYLKENSIINIVDPGDLTESELGVVMEFLIKKKSEGQFKTFWRGWEDGLRLIKSGEVYAMTGWEPIVYAAQKAGVNAQYAIPREGYEGWSNDLILLIGAENQNMIDVVHEFANWELNGYYGCELALEKGYIVPNTTTLDYAKKTNEFDVTILQKKLDNVINKFMNNKGLVYWQNTRPKNYKLYEEWWSKLRNA